MIRETVDYVWLENGRAFVYVVVNTATNWPYKAMLHRLGTHALDDVVLYEEKDPRFIVELASSFSGKFVFIGSSIDNIQSEWRAVDSREPLARPILFQPRTEGLRYEVDHCERIGFVLLVASPIALNGRIACVTQADAEAGSGSWKEELLPHDKKFFLRSFAVAAGGDFVVVERVNVPDMTDQLLVLNLADRRQDYVFDLNRAVGRPSFVHLTPDGSSFAKAVIRVETGDLVTPTQLLELNLKTREHRLVHQKAAFAGYDSSLYESRIEWAASRDGHSQIPISLVYRKDRKHQSSPLLLCGYSAYGLDEDPYFRQSRLSILDRGFAFAICHARGSSALGRQW